MSGHNQRRRRKGKSNIGAGETIPAQKGSVVGQTFGDIVKDCEDQVWRPLSFNRRNIETGPEN